MAVRQKLNLKQTQGLRLTPQVTQSLQLLQMTNLELSAFLQDELERNPLLEQQRSEAESAEETAGPSTDELAFDELGEFDDGSGAVYGGEGLGELPESPNFDRQALLEERVEAAVSLNDHLRDQILCDFGDPGEQMLALALLEELEPTGYYAGDLAATAERLGAAPEAAEKLLKRLQGLDPAGVFARDLKECLAAQLAERDRLDPAMQRLLDNLEMIGRGDLQRLRRRCNVDEEDFAEMLAELRQLDPKPGLSFEAAPSDASAPDILLTPREGGGWRIEINSESLPRLLVNRDYHLELKGSLRDKAARDYLSEQLASASWLVRALDQRQRTLLRVARVLVERQESFFRLGIAHLQPLTMREVAEALELHDSTISRAVAHKMIATPRGAFPLKLFFSAGVTNAEGEGHAAEAVKHRIKALVDAENPEKPLSDDKLVGLLGSEGIEVARRTVAKYRDALGLPSSAQRKRLNRAKRRQDAKIGKSRYSARDLAAM